MTAAVMLVLARRRLRLHGDQLLDFWDLAGFLLNAFLFLLIGTALPTEDVLAVSGSIVIGFVALTAVRAVAVYSITSVWDRRGRRISWRIRPVVVWGGMRGALSVALALSVRGHDGVANDVVAIAYGIVVVSLLLQGGTVKPLGRLCRLRDPEVERP